MARRIVTDPHWRTLPLFEVAPSALGPPSRSRRKEQRPLDLVLHIYWSASIEAHALGSLAARTPYPDQARALSELRRLEEQRKEVAAQILETIWRVKLPAATTHPEHEADVEDA